MISYTTQTVRTVQWWRQAHHVHTDSIQSVNLGQQLYTLSCLIHTANPYDIPPLLEPKPKDPYYSVRRQSAHVTTIRRQSVPALGRWTQVQAVFAPS